MSYFFCSISKKIRATEQIPSLSTLSYVFSLLLIAREDFIYIFFVHFGRDIILYILFLIIFFIAYLFIVDFVFEYIKIKTIHLLKFIFRKTIQLIKFGYNYIKRKIKER